MFNLIVVVDSKNGIAKDGKIPWHMPTDLKWFKHLTENKIVVMGFNTWASIGKKPLPNRRNVVWTSLGPDDVGDGVEALVDVGVLLRSDYDDIRKDIFVIGGEQTYHYFLEHDLVENIYLTRIRKDFNCDLFFPYDEYIDKFKGVRGFADIVENDCHLTFMQYSKKWDGIATNVKYPDDYNFWTKRIGNPAVNAEKIQDFDRSMEDKALVKKYLDKVEGLFGE